MERRQPNRNVALKGLIDCRGTFSFFSIRPCAAAPLPRERFSAISISRPSFVVIVALQKTICRGAVLGALLKYTPATIAAISFAVLCLAVTHEWAYFLVVGTQFQALMSATDYFTSSLFWLPLIIIGITGAALINLVLRRLENFRTEEEIAASFKSPKQAWRARRLPEVLSTTLIICLGLFQLIFENVYQIGVLSVAFGIAWLWLFIWIIKHEKVGKVVSRPTSFLLLFAPSLCVFAFFNGLSEGFLALTTVKAVYVVKLKDEPHERNWSVLRTLSAGPIARDLVDNRILFVRWENISFFAARVAVPDTRSIACRIADFRCPPTPPTP